MGKTLNGYNLLQMSKKGFKLPKGYSECVNRRRTKWRREKCRTFNGCNLLPMSK
jgi:hypothetical protein